MTGPMCRAARALLGISATTLAAESGVSVRSIHTCEKSAGIPRMNIATVERIQRALERLGIEFLTRTNGGVGVRLRR
jgi:predicted transcriptional regulator